MLETCIAEFVADLRAWDEAREVGNIDQALTDCIGLFAHVPPPHRDAGAHPTRRRRRAPSQDCAPRPRSPGSRTPRSTTASSTAPSTRVVDCIRATTVQAYALRHQIEIENVYETFYVLVYGLIGLTRSRPEIEDRVLIGTRATDPAPGWPTGHEPPAGRRPSDGPRRLTCSCSTPSRWYSGLMWFVVVAALMLLNEIARR